VPVEEEEEEDVWRLDVTESKYGNQTAPSPTIFEREAFKFKKYIFSKIYICQYPSHHKSVFWTQNQKRKRLHQKLVQIRSKTKIFRLTVRYIHT
jgi:hypothetical protein